MNQQATAIWLLSWAVPSLVAGVMVSAPVQAQIVPDTTLGTESSRLTPGVPIGTGPADRVDGGATRGSNLFHSFQEFNVGTGQRVYFANPTGIQTIFSRVTGSNRSNISGTLGVDGSASLFLLNPNGILFGPNAQLDIRGSFLATTGDRVTFADGSSFGVNNPQASLLTMSAPVGVQYGSAATIANQGNLTVGGDLTLAAGNLTLQGQLRSGGNLTLQAQDTLQIRDTVTQPFIASAAGQLLVQGNQKVDIFALNHPQSGFFSGSNLVLRSASVTGDAHFYSNGNVRIEQLNGAPGNLFSLHDPVILASGDVTLGDYTGASLHILAGGSVTLGNVTIDAPGTKDDTINPNNPNPFLASLATVTLSNGTSIIIDGSTTPTLDVRAGVNWAALGGIPTPDPTIIGTIPTPTLSTLPQSANIVAGFIDFSTDSGGTVFLSNQFVPNVLVPPGEISVNEIDSGGTFGGGDVTIDARSNVAINDLIITSAIDQGSSGNITVLAGGNITTNSLGILNTSARFADGDSGDVTLHAGGTIALNAAIDTSAAATGTDGFLQGSSGNVALTAGADINLQPGADIRVRGSVGGDVTIESGGNITARGVTIDADSNNSDSDPNASFSTLSLQAKGGSLVLDQAMVTAQNTGSNNAGEIILDARDRIEITNQSVLSGDGYFGQILIGQSFSPQSLQISNSQLSTTNAGAGEAGEIKLDARDRIEISNGSVLSGDGLLGTIQVGQSSPPQSLQISNSKLSTTNAGAGDAGDIVLDARDRIEITNQSVLLGNGNIGTIFIGQSFAPQSVQISNSQLSTTNEIIKGTQDAGVIFIQAIGNTSILNSTLTGTTTGVGQGGSIGFSTDSLSIVNSNLETRASGIGGNAGNVSIEAQDVNLQQSRILSDVSAGAIGNAGSIDIKAGKLSLTNNAQLSANTSGRGNAGDITITASDIALQQGNISSAVETTGIGNGGNLTIATGSLIANNASLEARTSGQGNAGNITITARDIVVSSKDGRITSSANPGSRGNGGNVTVTTGSLAVTDGAAIAASTRGQGNAGSVTITAQNTVDLQRGGRISSAVREGAIGNAGNVTIKTGSLTATENALLETSTNGQGNAGSIIVTARDRVSLQQGSTISNTVETSGSGRGGDITVMAPTISLRNGSGITADSKPPQNREGAGTIAIKTNSLTLDRNASISARSASGSGGNVQITAKDVLLLRRNSDISTTAGTQTSGGNGGNIALEVGNGFVVAVPSENSDIIANAFGGRGGRIQISAFRVLGLQQQSRLNLAQLLGLRSNGTSDISASSDSGLDGQVTIDSLTVDPAQGLVGLPVDLVDPTNLIAQGCSPEGGAIASRQSAFIVTGRGGLPFSPDDLFTSGSLPTPWVTRTPLSVNPVSVNPVSVKPIAVNPAITTPNPATLVEAQGVAIAANGEIKLSAQTPTAPSYLPTVPLRCQKSSR